MPHQCTNCGFTFPDSDDRLLSGCSDCGGQKFQFVSESQLETGSEPEPDRQQSSRGEAEPTSSERVGVDIEDTSTEQSDGSGAEIMENDAQARARSESVDGSVWKQGVDPAPREESDDEDILEPDPEPVPADDTEFGGEDEAELSEIRERLSSQFGSIKIRAPGQYSLNLMELYEKEEYIITLEEDGRYVIESIGSLNPERHS